MGYKYCNHCGAKINANATFCHNCGARQPISNLNNGMNGIAYNNYQGYQQSHPFQQFNPQYNQQGAANPQVDVWHIFWKNWSNYNGCTGKFLYNKIMIPAIIGTFLLTCITSGLGMVIFYVFLSCITIRRAHDVGMPTGWAVALVVLFGMILSVVLMFIDSRNMSNGRYKQRAINKGFPPIV